MMSMGYPTIPDVFRSQVFSLMCLLLLSLIPFLWGVLQLTLLAFRHGLPLFEHRNRWPDPFIEIPLVDEGPVSVLSLLADLDACEELLLIRFQCGQVFRRKYIRRAVETRQFGEFANQLGRC